MSLAPGPDPDIALCVAAIRARTGIVPRVGVVLGSGLGGAADRVALDKDGGTAGAVFATSDLPGWPRSTVVGHDGKLVVGYWRGTPVAVLRGRTHAYEGYPLERITLPHRVLAALGIETLLVTNAVGTFNLNFAPGDLMLVRDHINQIGRRGLFTREDLARVPALARGAIAPARPYTPAVLETLRTVAREAKIRLREGVLLAGTGPAYETSAEIRVARLVGADAACMSSAHEMDLAAALGLHTGAVSCITNYGTGISPNALSHHEVEQVAGAAAGRLEELLAGAVARL
ncbi:MAG: purine-nucleoside phosphorylase [Candidatus Eisenbacteria bacterium]